MSQQKVDRYKEYKKNRKDIIAREKKSAKLKANIAGGVIGAVALLLVGALGVTFVNVYKDKQASNPIYEREALIISDLAGILTEAE